MLFTNLLLANESFVKVSIFDMSSTITHMIQQKRLRKNVVLTDLQSRELHKLSEFDGLNPVEHARKAIDEYLQKHDSEFRTPKEHEISAEFKDRSPDTNIQGAIWLSGVVDRYEFSVLILKAPSKSGIDKGKISKLSIWDPIVMENTNSFIGSCIMNYDRGWDIKPSKIAQPYYNKVKSMLDSSSDQFIKKDNSEHLRNSSKSNR